MLHRATNIDKNTVGFALHTWNFVTWHYQTGIFLKR
ncbi:hypothetical protein SAMN06269250_3526 [Spirosoma fluviale]|uniref:Uncharacterized protein n=1 Tax=Spirosoma fluviale TaxID=1597977 RepID=A0A286G5C3_9BACT|nr:hypothetical protein SAMN06269250_3526 [Spirosoma fluviale]